MSIRHQREAIQFARRIEALGFKVYLAESLTYGFITDETESRVLSFEYSFGEKLSGNYGPGSTQSGTGWGMDKAPSELRTAEDVHEALYARPPLWVGKGWKYLSTVAQHLAQYGSSSRYAELPVRNSLSGCQMGTGYFRSRSDAVRYYAKQHVTAANVDRKLAEGEIYIGHPAGLKHGDIWDFDQDGRAVITRA